MSFLPLAVPDIEESDIDAVAAVLRSGMLVQGEQVAALEAEIADYLGVRHAVAVSNGTASLHLALVALGVGPGDEVIVPAFSFVATANVVELVGARCVFVDVQADTFNIDPDLFEAAITPRTKAVIPVHEFGLCCDIGRVVEIASARNIAVVEDAACALGATEHGRHAGSFGEIGSFSLHPRKAVTAGEGGIVTTSDDALAERFRVLRNHGISSAGGDMQFVAAGFNYRLTDFQAALVRGQFARFDATLARRRALADGYFAALRGVDGITLPAVPDGKAHSWQTFHPVVSDGVDRDALIAALRARGIGSNYGAQCIPAQVHYRAAYGHDSARDFPNAWRAYRQGIALPLFGRMTDDDVARAATALRESLAAA